MPRDVLYADLIASQDGLASVKRKRKRNSNIASTLPRSLSAARPNLSTAIETSGPAASVQPHYNAQLQARMRFNTVRQRRPAAPYLVASILTRTSTRRTDAPPAYEEAPDAQMDTVLATTQRARPSLVPFLQASQGETTRSTTVPELVNTSEQRNEPVERSQSANREDVQQVTLLEAEVDKDEAELAAGEASCLDMVADHERQAYVAMLETDLGPLPFWLMQDNCPATVINAFDSVPTVVQGCHTSISSPMPSPCSSPTPMSPVSYDLELTRRSIALEQQVTDFLAMNRPMFPMSAEISSDCGAVCNTDPDLECLSSMQDAETCSSPMTPDYCLHNSFVLDSDDFIDAQYIRPDLDGRPLPPLFQTLGGCTSDATDQQKSEEDWFQALEVLVEKLSLDKIADARIRELEAALAASRKHILVLEQSRNLQHRPQAPISICERLWQPKRQAQDMVQNRLWTRAESCEAQQARDRFLLANASHPNITPRSQRRQQSIALAAGLVSSPLRPCSPRAPDPSFYQYSDPALHLPASPLPCSIRTSRLRLFRCEPVAVPEASALNTSTSSTETIRPAPTRARATHAPVLRVSRQHLSRRGTIPRTKDFATAHASAPMNLPSLEAYQPAKMTTMSLRKTERPALRMNPHLSKRLPFAPDFSRETSTTQLSPFSRSSHRLGERFQMPIIDRGEDAKPLYTKTMRKHISPFAPSSPPAVRAFVKSRNDENKAPLTPSRSTDQVSSETATPKQKQRNGSLRKATPKKSPGNACTITRASGRIVSGQLAEGGPLQPVLQEQANGTLNNAMVTVRMRSPSTSVSVAAATGRPAAGVKELSPLTVGRLSMTPIESPPARLKRRAGYRHRLDAA